MLMGKLLITFGEYILRFNFIYDNEEKTLSGVGRQHHMNECHE